MQKKLLPGDVMAAPNTTTHNVEVTDNGSTANVIKNIETLIKSLKAAETQARFTMSAASTTAPRPTITPASGGTAGSRAVAEGMMSGSAYGTLRATGAGTGAAGRDFAKESQGLGGLVRLYATYAANLFAVTAAFGALSKAMDTTNMISSMNQLGAASGKSLGTISKNVVQLTDGAISLAEAMQAVSKTSAAGIAGKDIERLAVVAKNASLSLGISMPDALNRLSRGVTKLEPELLDELGLFTKIGPATEAYARTLGKSVTSLSDYERRQAFLNGVLKEGEEKFAVLGDAVNANPYDKLAASLQNLAQKGLSLINTVLGPILNILSESPVALSAAITAVGLAIVKQALPAFGQFKEGLASQADIARNLAISKAQEARAAQQQIAALATRDFEQQADTALAAVTKQEKKIAELRKKGQFDATGATAIALAKDTADVGGRDYKKMEEERRKYLKAGNAQAAEAVKSVMESFKAYQALENEVTKVRLAEQQRQKDLEAGNNNYARTLKAADRAQQEATKSAILSNAAINQSLIGPIDAWRLFTDQVQKSGLQLTSFEKTMFNIRGAAAIAGSAIAGFGAALSSALNIIGLIVAVFSTLSIAFSKNAKEMSKYNSAIDAVDEAVANANRTITLLYKTSSGDPNSIKGVNALANAFRELSTRAQEAVTAAKTAKDTMGGLEKTIDFAKRIYGGNVDSELAKKLSADIMSAIKIADSMGLGGEARTKLKGLLGVENITFDNLKDSILSVGIDGVQPTLTWLKQLENTIGTTDDKLQNFDKAVDNTFKSYQDFLQSSLNNDPMFKLAQNIGETAIAMQDLKEAGIDGLSKAFKKFADSPEKAAFLGKDFTDRILAARKEFQTDQATLKRWGGELLDVNTKIEEAVTARDKLIESRKKGFSSVAGSVSSQEQLIDELKDKKKGLEDAIKITVNKENFKDIATLMGDIIKGSFEKSAELIEKSLKNAAELNQLKLARADLQGLTGTERVKEEGRISRAEIAIRERGIDAQVELMTAQDRLIAAIEENTAAIDKETAVRQGAPQSQITRADDKQTAAAALKSILSDKSIDFKQALQTAPTKFNLTPQAADILQRDLYRIQVRQAQTTQLKQDLATERGVVNKNEGYGTITGDLEKKQKALTLETQTTQAALQRKQVLDSIIGVTDKNSIIEENALEKRLLGLKQEMEENEQIAQVKRAERSKNPVEIDKQNKILDKIRERQGLERDLGDLQGRQKLLQDELNTRTKIRELDKSSRDLDTARLARETEIKSAQISSYQSLFENSKEYTNSLQNANELEKIQNDYNSKYAQEEANIIAKREDAALRIADLAKDDVKGRQRINIQLEREVKLADDNVIKLGIEKETRERILEVTKKQQAVQLAIDKVNRENELELSKLKIQNTLTNNSLNLEQARFDIFKNLSSETDEYIINQQFALNLRKDEESTLQQIVGLQQELNNKRKVSAAKVTAFKEAGGSGPELAKLEAGEKANLEFEAQKTQNAIAAIKLEEKGRGNVLGIQKEQAIEQAKYNKQLLDANTFATDLKDTFGTFGDKLQTVGTALGSIVTSLAEEAIRQEKYSRLNLENQTALNAAIKEKNALENAGANDKAIAEAKKKVATIEKKIADDDNKNTKSQLSNAATTVSSFKKAFSEKTAAYKAFAAVEKAIGIAKIALDIQKMISDTAATSSAIANSSQRAAAQVGEAEVSGGAAILKTMASIPFPANLVAATLVAAAVGTVLSKIGGKSTNYTAGDGNTGTGTTLGDKNKPSETLSQSIEILNQSDPILMRNSSEMLRHLRNIDYGIANLGATLAKSLGASDIATGKVGVKSGSSAIGQSILGTAIGAEIGAVIGSALLGPGGAIIGYVAGGLLTALGALSTKIKVQGQGIQGGPQTAEQIKQQGFQGNYYADVQQSSSFLGIRIPGTTSNTTQVAALDEDLKRNLGLIFTNTTAAILASSKVLGVNTQEFTDKVNSFVYDIGKIPLDGLSIEDQAKRIEAVVGAQIDRAVEFSLPGIKDFAQVNEGLGTTLARVVYGVESANTSLGILGIQAIKYTDILNKQGDIGGEIVRQSILATETQTLIRQVIENADGSAQDIIDLYTQLDTLRDKLVDLGISQAFLTEKVLIAAGGTDAFSDSLGKFYDKFTTETFKASVETSKATAVFTKLGLQVPKTREEFATLFNTLSTVKPEAAASLLKVIDAIDALYTATEKIVTEKADLLNKIDELTLTTAQLREKELSKISDGNKVYQRYIYALTDQQNAAKAYQSALQNVTKTLTTQITTLKDYKTSLLMSSSSTRTTTQQYSAAKTEVDNLINIIKTSAVPEERSAAFSKLTGATDKFLGLSKELFASGAQYSADFDTILTTVDDVTRNLETQKTDAQRQLDALESSNTFLENIEDSTQTTAELMQRYLDATATVITAQAAASAATTTANAAATTTNAANTAATTTGAVSVSTTPSISSSGQPGSPDFIGAYNPNNAGYSAGPGSSQAAAPNVVVIDTTTLGTIVAEGVAAGMTNAAAAIAEPIVNAVNVGTVATNNNTQAITGTLNNNTNRQVSATVLTRRANNINDLTAEL